MVHDTRITCKHGCRRQTASVTGVSCTCVTATSCRSMRLEKTGVVKVALGRELENYLLDEAALTTVVRARRKDKAVQAEEIARVIKEVADGLQQTVVLKRVCGQLAPIRLMDNDLRRRLANERADLDGLLESVTARLETPTALKHKIETLWGSAQESVSSSWVDDWRSLAPGEEVLGGVWRHFGLGGYSKATDGPKIAAEMSGPPGDLVVTLSDFLK